MKKLPYIILDIECSMKPIMHIWQRGSFLSSIGIQTPDHETKVWFFNPLIGDDTHHLEEIQSYLNNTELVVGHNIKFDASWLFGLRFNIPANLWCTMVVDFLLSGQNKQLHFDLNSVSDRYGFGSKLDEMKTYWDAGINTDMIPVDLHREYLTQDLNLTHAVFKEQYKRVRKSKLTKVVTLSNALTKELSLAELAGAPFSMEQAEEYLLKAAIESSDHVETLQKIAGINFLPTSPVQLRSVLYGGEIKSDGVEHYTVTLKSGVVKEKSRKCKVVTKYPGMGFTSPTYAKTKTGEAQTGKDVLSVLKAKSNRQREFLQALLDFKQVSKIVSTIKGSKEDTGWLSKVAVDGRLHGSFLQIATWTGRLSSRDPNMQNLPRSGTSPLKSIFVAPQGYVIIDADLAQIEWRVAAELCRDPVMLQELLDGVDIHSANAVQIFGANPDDKDSSDEKKRKLFKATRQAAKTVSFRLLYGGGPWGFYYDFRMPDYTIERWTEIVDAFYKKYKGLKDWHMQVRNQARIDGHVRTPSGRVIISPEVDWSDDKSVRRWERELCNYPVQSFSADIINLVAVVFMHKVREEYKLDAKLIMMVHDSLVIECKEEHAEKIMTNLLDMFSSLTYLVNSYFNIDMVVPLDGDCKVGRTYGTVQEVTRETMSDVLSKL